jgi:hypothetical protein
LFHTQRSYARDIAARPGKTWDEAARHRIAPDSKNDRDGLGRRLGGKRGRRADHHVDDRDAPADQITHEARQPFIARPHPAVLDCDVPPLDITGLGQPLEECILGP